MATTSARLFRWHRWLGWLVVVVLQVLAWVAGSFVFTWLPFESRAEAQACAGRPRLAPRSQGRA